MGHLKERHQQIGLAVTRISRIGVLSIDAPESELLTGTDDGLSFAGWRRSQGRKQAILSSCPQRFCYFGPSIIPVTARTESNLEHFPRRTTSQWGPLARKKELRGMCQQMANRVGPGQLILPALPRTQKLLPPSAGHSLAADISTTFGIEAEGNDLEQHVQLLADTRPAWS